MNLFKESFRKLHPKKDTSDTEPKKQGRSPRSLGTTDNPANRSPSIRAPRSENETKGITVSGHVVPSKSRLDEPADFEIRSSSLWDRAVAKVKLTDEWQALLKIQLSRPENSDKEVSISLSGTAPSSVADKGQLSQLVSEVKDLTAKHEDKTKSRKILEGICKKTLATFSAANAPGAAAATFNPYAALAWGLVQYVVSTAQNFAAVRKLCWDNLPLMGILASRYQLLEDIYKASNGIPKTKRSLEEALEALYVAVLSFQLGVVVYVQSSMEKVKAGFIPVAGSLPQKLLDDITQAEKEVEKQQSMSDGELGVSTYQKVSKIDASFELFLKQSELDAEKVNAQLEHILTTDRSNNRHMILEWLSPIRYESSHTKPEKTPELGTNDWIRENQKYKTWTNSYESAGLWLHGFMGTGKSCLAHEVIQDRLTFKQAHGPEFAVAYFYCDGVNPEEGERHQLNSENILSCVLKGIVMGLDASRLPEAVVQIYDAHRSSAKGPTAEQCIRLILGLSPQLSMLTLVFDGLDECSPGVRGELLGTLEDIFTSIEIPIKIFLTSRDETDIRRTLNGWITSRIDIVEHNEKAINKMILARVGIATQREPTRTLYLDGKDQSPRVITELKANAHGMFRWVQMAFAWLHKSPNYRTMKTRLGELKHLDELFKLYEKIYENMLFEASPGDARVIETALVLLLQGVIGHMVFNEACTFAGTGSMTDAYNAVYIVDLSPSFLTARKSIAADEGEEEDANDEDDEQPSTTSIHFQHFSIREYLLERYPFKYSKAARHAHIASLCMQVFSNPKLDLIPGKYPQIPTSFADYAAFWWSKHVYYTRWLQQHGEEHERRISDQTHLLYERAFAGFLPPGRTSIGFERWHKYLMPRTLDRPRMLDRSYARSKLWRAIFSDPASTLYSHMLFDMSLAGAGFSDQDLHASSILISSRTKINDHPLHFAASLGRFDAIQWLIEHTAGNESRSERCTKVLNFLAECDLVWNSGIPNSMLRDEDSLVQVIELLLANGAVLHSPKLACAILLSDFDGDFDIRRILSSYFLDRNLLYSVVGSDASTFITTLISDLEPWDTGLAKVVCGLIPRFKGRGVDLECWNSCLQMAAGSGVLEVVCVLIENGADPTAQNDSGQSSLDVASVGLQLILRRLAEEVSNRISAGLLRRCNTWLRVVKYLASLPGTSKVYSCRVERIEGQAEEELGEEQRDVFELMRLASEVMANKKPWLIQNGWSVPDSSSDSDTSR